MVWHIGLVVSGSFKNGDSAYGIIDKERRDLHSRLHSAGHLIDMAVNKLGYSWLAQKSYHFVDGPYVEYEGSLENNDPETLKKT